MAKMIKEKLEVFFNEIYEDIDSAKNKKNAYRCCLYFPVFKYLSNNNEWHTRENILNNLVKEYDVVFSRGSNGLSFDHLFSQRFGKGDESDFLNLLIEHDAENVGDKKENYRIKRKYFDEIKKFTDVYEKQEVKIAEMMHKRMSRSENDIEPDDNSTLSPMIYKHSPGEGADDWPFQRKEEVVGIGWTSSGSLEKFDKDSDFKDAAKIVKDSGDGKDIAYISKNFKGLMNLRKGDLILYYGGNKKILGAAIVVDDSGYSYKGDDKKNGHQRKVKFITGFTEFDLINDKLLSFFGHRKRTLEVLSKTLFKPMVKELKNSNPNHNWDKYYTKRKLRGKEFDGIKKEAFEILARFKKNPTVGQYNIDRNDAKDYLTDPLHILMNVTKGPLNRICGELMETDKHIVSAIRKQFAERNGIHEHVWSAFYDKNSKRSESSQLFIMLKHDHIRMGFGFGKTSHDYRERLTSFLKRNKEFGSEYFSYLNEKNIKLIVNEGNHHSSSKIKDVSYINILEELEKEEWNFSVGEVIKDEDVVALGSSLELKIQSLFLDLLPLYIVSVTDKTDLFIKRWSRLTGFRSEDKSPDELFYKYDYSWNDLKDEMNWKDTFTEFKNLKYALDGYETHDYRKRSLIFVGPPGTGKTKCAEFVAEMIARNDENITKVQFHQSYSYENFIQSIMPSEKNGQITYNIEKGPFTKLCEDALENEDQNFVIFIDEINRGNISRIFGELMHLIEYPEKSIKLMYNDETLQIPKNVFLIGTMNSADRSIAVVDFALRRRFKFVQLDPRVEILKSFYGVSNDEHNRVLRFFSLLNEKIGNRDRRLKIGHSFFIDESLKEIGLSRNFLVGLWETELFPLIIEYFGSNPNVDTEFDFKILWEESKRPVEVNDVED